MNYFNVPNKNQEVLNKKHGAVARPKNLIYLGKHAQYLLANQCSAPSGRRLFPYKKATRYITGNIEKPKLDIPLLTIDNP